ncbi:MAG: ABC transporter ATP-binding protein [Calditrichaeota bacterium]|nr:ABC transporter ATP-binding protein [Calditrichota bacterium]
MEIIETLGLTKNYNLKKAVNNLNLKINKATFFGFVGPNGAGKTTTVNMLTGITPPSSGKIKIFGLDFEENNIEIKKSVGVVPEDLSLFEQLKAEEQLYFTARVYGLDRQAIKSRTNELFDVFDLQNQRNKFVREYSKGMKKKLALMCAIIHDPELIFLDEPFEGLDPISSKIIQDNLKLMVQNGTTIFLTSHNLDLVEKLCKEIAIIHNGELILQSPTEQIRNRIKSRMSNEKYSGLEELFLDLVSQEKETKYLSWIKKG